MKKITYIKILVAFAITAASCSKFLNEKPNRSFAIPDNVKDLQALLDNEDLNNDYPESGDIAADYYYISASDWQSRNIDVRNTYAWLSEAQYYRDWNNSYKKIFYCNVVLDGIDPAKLGGMTETNRREVKGRALLLRGWALFQLAQTYVPHYNVETDDTEYGIPLKLTSDINEPVIRATVKKTYEQIIADLTQAGELLPDNSGIATRPSKAAAYGALARLYLVLGDYEKSLTFAENTLSLNNVLIDYNTLDTTANLPFDVLNDEVQFHAVISSISGVHARSRAFVDSTLVNKYDEYDLRKKVFLQKDPSGYHRFKGSYTGSANTLFAGIANDEMYLTKAEALARMGQDEEALETLNALVIKRWETGKFIPYKGLSGTDLLDVVLEEREKQLLFRGGIRWSDLRRLNRDPRYAKTLVRKIGDQTYELPPNDLRYTFLIPENVIQMSGITQNPR